MRFGDYPNAYQLRRALVLECLSMSRERQPFHHLAAERWLLGSGDGWPSNSSNSRHRRL
jgi:hypothetical protein